MVTRREQQADLTPAEAVDRIWKLAEEIDILRAVGVPHAAALGPDHRDRERRVVQHGAGVAAWRTSTAVL